MPELLLCCVFPCSHCRLLCALRCCLLLLQLCLLLKNRRTSTFSTFFTGFCHFLIFSNFAVSYFSYFAVTFLFFIDLSAFLYYLSFLLPDEACGLNVVNSTVCCSSFYCSSVCCCLNYHTSILSVLHKSGNFFSVSHFGPAIVVFSARLGAAFCCFNFAFGLTILVRPFVIFLYWVLPLSNFSHFAVSYFSYFAVTFFSS